MMHPHPAEHKPAAAVEEQPAAAPPQAAAPLKKINNHKKGKTLWAITLALLLIGCAWLLLWFFYFQFYESTDDAYVNGNMVRINAAIDGSVIAFYAEETDLVLEGQLLVELDPTNYREKYEGELATLAATVLQVRQLYERILSNRAIVERNKVDLARAQFDYENRQQLVQAKAVSNEDFIHAKQSYMSAKATLQQAEHDLQVSIDQVGPFAIRSHPLIEEQKAKVREAFYNLYHCTIVAPCTGFVAQRTVQVGQSVAPLTPLMSVIAAENMWVDANFKETQLTYMRIGQPAEVTLDIYGSRALYKGRVLGIASGTGSVFSLIPPQNATGNWIKIVQRLPVRIYLDTQVLKKFPARLGLSAYVSVNLTRQDLPMLAPAPTQEHRTATKVFDIEMKKVDQLMEQIVEKSLDD